MSSQKQSNQCYVFPNSKNFLVVVLREENLWASGSRACHVLVSKHLGPVNEEVSVSMGPVGDIVLGWGLKLCRSTSQTFDSSHALLPSCPACTLLSSKRVSFANSSLARSCVFACRASLRLPCLPLALFSHLSRVSPCSKSPPSRAPLTRSPLFALLPRSFPSPLSTLVLPAPPPRSSSCFCFARPSLTSLLSPTRASPHLSHALLSRAHSIIPRAYSSLRAAFSRSLSALLKCHFVTPCEFGAARAWTCFVWGVETLMYCTVAAITSRSAPKLPLMLSWCRNVGKSFLEPLDKPISM